MLKKVFSTGIPRLDEYIGFMYPGDSVLIFASEIENLSVIYKALASHAISLSIPVVYLSVDDSLLEILKGIRKLSHLKVISPKVSKRSMVNAVKRFASIHTNRSYIVLDDLSKWKNIIGNEQVVADLFESFASLAKRKKSVLISISVRSGFTVQNLARLKDSSTVCLDLLAHRDELFVLPLSLRGRYIQRGIYPLRLKLPDLTKSIQPRIEQAAPPSGSISESEISRLQKDIFASDEKYVKMFRDAGEAIVLFDLKGNYRDVNRQMEELLGYSSNELNIVNPISLVSLEHRFRAMRFILELRHKKKHSISLDVRRKNGKIIPIEVHASSLGEGLFMALFHDISERRSIEKHLRQSEEEYRLLLDNSPFPIIIVHNIKPVYANRSFYRMFGCQSFEDISSRSVNYFLTKDSARRYQKFIRENQSFIEARSMTEQALRNDGFVIDCQITVNEVRFNCKSCLRISFLDISTHQEIVKKLTASEEKYRNLVEYSGEPVSLISEGKYVYVNQAFMKLFGFSSLDEVIGKDVSVVVEETERDHVREVIEKRGAGKHAPTAGVYTGIRQDKTKLVIELIVAPIQFGIEKGMIAFHRDITERKLLENNLSERMKEKKLLDEIVLTAHGSIDLQKIQRASLHKIMDILSWDTGAFYLTEGKSKELQVVYHRGVSEHFIKKLSTFRLDEGIGGLMMKTQEPHFFHLEKYPSYLPFRSFFEEAGIKEICFLPLLSQNNLVGMILGGSKKRESAAPRSIEFLSSIGNHVGTALANAKSYQTISESNEKYHTLIESISDVLYSASPNGAIVYISSNVEGLVGYLPKEFYRNGSLWLQCVHPDDKKILLERTTRLHELGDRSVSEYRILPKGKASYRWIRDVITIRKNDSGNVEIISGILSDITGYKELAEELQESDRLKTSILASIQEGVVVYDRDLRCVQWNEAMEKITGVVQEEVLREKINNMFPGFEEQGIGELLQRALTGEMVSSDTVRYHFPRTNSKGYIWVRFSPLRNAAGEILGVVGIITDISDRKRLEDEIRESEQVLRNVIDTMGDVLILTNLKGEILQVNRAFLRVLGYTRSEVLQHDFPYPWLLDEEMGRYVLWIANLREKSWLHDFDMTWKAKDGHNILMSLSTTLLRNSVGEPIAMLNIARDITDRKRLGLELESRNKQIELINRIITKANHTLDFDEIFAVIANEINEIVVCEEVNVALLSEDGNSITIYASTGTYFLHQGVVIPIENTVSQFAIREQKPIIISDLAANEKYRHLFSFKEGLRSQLSLPISLKGKTFATLNVGSREPHTFSDDHIKVLQPIAQQIGAIIDRVLLFKQVSEDAAYIHNLLDSIDSVVYTVDTRYRIREVNRAWHEFIRASGGTVAKDYHGMNLFEVLPSESLKIAFQNVVDQLLTGSIRYFSQEFIHDIPSGERIYQLTIHPMIIGRKITGLVFTHTDITALKKSEAELKKNNEQLLTLNEISSLISTSLDLTEILDMAIPLLHKTLEATAVLVYLMNQSEADLTLVKHAGFDMSSFGSVIRLQKSSSATGIVIRTKEPLYITENAYRDERIVPQNREILKQMHIESMAVVPLVSKDKVLGALDIFYQVPHNYSSQERQLLVLVGNQLGAAIENTQLYGELRSQIERLTVLYEFSQQLTSTLDIDRIFQVVYENVQRVVPFEKFNIDLYDSKQKAKTPALHVESINGERIIIPKLNQSLSLEEQSPDCMVVESKQSYQNKEHTSMYVPMLSKESIIGIMSVEGNQTKPYTDTHLRLLESIGNLAAIALEKGKLYEETVQKSLEIQRRNKELDDFTYVVSHDLKEPLISIEGFSNILLLDYQDVIKMEGKEYLESIVGASGRMKCLIDDLLMLSRIGRISESFKNVSMKSIVDDILTDMEYVIKQKEIQVIVPDDLPNVFGNETHLKVVVRNLIGNAIKFNNKPSPMVEIGFHNMENNSYLFYVRDNGIGIDKQFHEKVFVIFQRLHRREEYEGTGAGLAIVKKIIEMHNGKIWLESEPGKGSTFFFTIPKEFTKK